jgi:hypothetical protein
MFTKRQKNELAKEIPLLEKSPKLLINLLGGLTKDKSGTGFI